MEFHIYNNDFILTTEGGLCSDGCHDGTDTRPERNGGRRTSMSKLSGYTRFADAQRHYSTAALWDLFDGAPQAFNIAHECVDRYAQDPARIAVRVAHADGRD